MMLDDAQRGVALGMAAGLAVTLAAWIFPPMIWPHAVAVPNLGGRLAFLVPWELAPVATFVAGVAWIARYRFFHPAVIDGQNPADDGSLTIARSYLQNTQEQLVLAFCVHGALAVLLPSYGLVVIPASATLFVVGRVLFAVGYGRGAASRSFGFAVTFYPSVVGLLAAIAVALARVVGF